MVTLPILHATHEARSGKEELEEGRRLDYSSSSDSPISILLRREDEELGPGPARAGYRVSGSGLAWEAVSIGLVLSWSYFINTHQNKARLLLQP